MMGLSDVDISEDNELRSQFIWDLINNQNNFVSHRSNKSIPHVIIQFWDDELIPSDVQKCINSWHSLEKQGFGHLVFNDITASRFIKNNFDDRYVNAFRRCLHPAMRSDYFRLCYLLKNGGFYTDADDLYKKVCIEELFSDDNIKIQPLCYDLSTNSMIKTNDFIPNKKYCSNRIYYINNDPIISSSNHPLIQLALERSTQILLSINRREDMKDIQSITGPGNLTASLVKHAIELKSIKKEPDFRLLDNWDNVAMPQWPLDYRKDNRNWRLWDGSNI